MVSNVSSGRNVEGIVRGLIRGSFPGICLDGLRKTTKIISEGSRGLIRDADSRLIFEEGETLPTILRLLVLRYWLDKTGLRQCSL
jgi:hypothetical protein